MSKIVIFVDKVAIYGFNLNIVIFYFTNQFIGVIQLLIAFLDLLDTEEEKSKFQELYCKYDNLLMWIAMQKLHNSHWAEESVQDAWFYIAKNFDKIKGIDSSHAKGYLATVAEGFAISKFRKETKIVKLKDMESTDLTGIYNDSFDTFSASDLKIAIDSLNDEYKNLLYLTYVYGYTSFEISEIYGIKPANVRKRIQFAKEEIRNYFKEESHE